MTTKVKIIREQEQDKIVEIEHDSFKTLLGVVEYLSKYPGVRSVEICTDDVEELEQETDVDETTEKSCLDVAEDTLLDNLDIY